MGIEAAFFGTLGKDGSEHTSSGGKRYLRLNVRVGDGDGALWVSVMAFDKDANDHAEKFIKGARVYCEGSLRPSEWTSPDGEPRHGLSVMSWHCRLAQIGRNRPKRQRKSAAPSPATTSASERPFDDPLPRWMP